MAKVIGIIGESGAGKTTSMRNLNPKETMYLDCDKKGLSWKGWRTQYNTDNKNYVSTDQHQIVMSMLQRVNDEDSFKHIKTVIVDTLNGLMVADEMRRMQEKSYDKWQDLAQSVYYLLDYALTMRDDLTIIFVCHSQTDHDENGYLFTKIKTSGRKLDKICLESKMTTVLLADVKDGKHIFHTKADRSTCKTPLGAFDQEEIENDITKVIKALEEF